jgi:hypothetical protein
MTEFHFVMIGIIKSESKEVALEILKAIMNKNEDIKDISELEIFGKTLDKKNYLITISKNL